jgi:hypothetical protein
MADPRIKRAKALIAKNGMEVTWRQLTDGMPLDPSKPWITSESECQEYTVDIVFLPDERLNFQTSRLMDRSEVPTGFGVAYMSGQEFKPKVKDVIIRNGEELVVNQIRTIAPAGEDILYELEIGE